MVEKWKPSAFLFNVKDWLTSPSVSCMTPAEEGAYIRLLAISWDNDNCELPACDKKLAILSRLGDDWFSGSGDKIKENFIKKGRAIYNCRLRQEKEKLMAVYGKRMNGAKHGAEKRWKSREIEEDGGMPYGMPKGMVEESLEAANKIKLNKRKEKNTKKEHTAAPPDSIQEQMDNEERQKREARFNEFWEEYGKKIDPKKCKSWYDRNVTEATHQEIIRGVRKWHASGQWDDKQYQPHPSTFLNNERWKAEPPKSLSKEEMQREQNIRKFLAGDIH